MKFKKQEVLSFDIKLVIAGLLLGKGKKIK